MNRSRHPHCTLALALSCALTAGRARADSAAPARPAPPAASDAPIPAPSPAAASAPTSTTPALPPLPSLDKIIFAKLHAGIIVSEAEDDDGHGGRVHGWAVCRCDIDAVWSVLTNHAPFPEFVPRVAAMEISNRGPNGERALQTIDATIATVKYALDYSWDLPTRHIDFHLVEEVPHDLKSVRGSWQLWPLDHGAATLIDYQSAVDTGRQIPGFIRDYLADRGVKDTMDAVRKRAEQLGGNAAK